MSNFTGHFKYTLYAIEALAVFATMLTLWIHGPRTCSDATGYIMGAISLKHSHAFLWQASDDELVKEGFGYEFKCPKNSVDLNEYRRDKAQGYQVHWAVGYPFSSVLLSQMTRLNLKHAFCLVNTLSILATLLCVWSFCRVHANSVSLEMKLVFAIVFSSYLWLISMVAFSEALFLPMSLLSLFALDCYLRHKSPWALIVSALLCGACLLIRYAGLYLIPAGMFVLFFQQVGSQDCSSEGNKHRCIRERFLPCCFYAIVSILPYIVWQVRNYLVSGAIRGGRIAEPDFFARFLDILSLPAISFFPIPPQIQNGTCISILLTVLSFALAFLLLVLLGLSLKIKANNGKILLVSALSYVIFICVTTLVTGEPYPLNYRIMLPSLFPLCLYGMINYRTEMNNKVCLWGLRTLLFASFAWTHLYLFLFLAKNLYCVFRFHG